MTSLVTEIQTAIEASIEVEGNNIPCYRIAISNKKSYLLFKRILCREYGFSTKNCCRCYCSICSHSHEGRLSDLERNLYRMMIRHVIYCKTIQL